MIKTLVEEAVQADLFKIAPKSPGSAHVLWEYKTWNLHRGVIYLDRSEPFSSARDVEQQLRQIVASEYRLGWAWLRGFAFGACVHAPNLPPDAAVLEKCIDTYNRLKGVFQWLVYVSDSPRVAFGVHTWIEGYLSKTYRRLLQQVILSGLACPSFVRDKGNFFAFAQKIGSPPMRDFEQDG